MRRTWSIVLISLSLSGLAGCAAWRPAPTALPFPDKPTLHAAVADVGGDKMLCLPHEDATALVQWLDKLNVFRHAYERRQ